VDEHSSFAGDDGAGRIPTIKSRPAVVASFVCAPDSALRSRPDALEQSLFARGDSRCRELAATRGRCINKTSITIQFPGWGSRKKVLIFWVRLARVRTPSMQNDCNEEFIL